MIVNNTKIIDPANTRKMLNIKEALQNLNDCQYINKQYKHFDNTLKLFAHRTMKQKVKTITSNLDGDGNHKNIKDLFFNENSIDYTSTKIHKNINNETSKLDHYIDILLAPIRKSTFI